MEFSKASLHSALTFVPFFCCRFCRVCTRAAAIPNQCFACSHPAPYKQIQIQLYLFHDNSIFSGYMAFGTTFGDTYQTDTSVVVFPRVFQVAIPFQSRAEYIGVKHWTVRPYSKLMYLLPASRLLTTCLILGCLVNPAPNSCFHIFLAVMCPPRDP